MCIYSASGGLLLTVESKRNTNIILRDTATRVLGPLKYKLQLTVAIKQDSNFTELHRNKHEQINNSSV